MKCRSCGTEIADRAIVCFRCGTPTDIPAAAPRPPAPRSGPALVAGPVLLVVVLVALGMWLLPPLMTPGASGLWLGWAALVLAAAAAAWLLRRGRRP